MSWYSTPSEDECAGECIEYPHQWALGGRGLCRNCNTLGTGDPCGDGDCLGHPDYPRITRFNQQLDVLYVLPDGSCFYTPDGEGRVWFDTEDEGLEQLALSADLHYLTTEQIPED